MKSKIINRIALSVLSIGIFTSCNEEKISPEELNIRFSEKISMKNGQTSFQTLVDFSEFVENNEARESFVRQVESKREDLSKSGRISLDGEVSTGDDFLDALLDQNQIVRIGDYFIKIDLPNEKVYVLPDYNSEEYDDLVSVNLQNNNIMVFSTDDEVIHLLEEGSTGTQNGRTEFCSESGARDDFGDEYWCYPEDICDDDRIHLAAHYLKSGVWFTLNAKMEHQTKGGIWWSSAPLKDSDGNIRIHGVRMQGSGSFKPKCRSTQTINETTTENCYNSSGVEVQRSWNGINQRPYSSTRKLTSYSYTVRYTHKDQSSLTNYVELLAKTITVSD
ncbi:MAG: hypothetical protein JXQ90_17435 [Cyclobacteriaceae bacterium]